MKRFHHHDPNVPVWKVLWWYLLSLPSYAFFLVFHRFLIFGNQNIPRQGPILYVVNHQSHLDPVIVGLGGIQRTISFFARASLFENPMFGWLIRSLNAVPVERGGRGDMKAIRALAEVLKQERALLMFPEGTRGTVGTVAKFQPGIKLMIKRGNPWVVPVAIEGARHAMPKGQGFRLFKKIGVKFGQAVRADDLLALDDPLATLRDQVEQMRIEVGEHLDRY